MFAPPMVAPDAHAALSGAGAMVGEIMSDRPRLFHERVELEERQQRGDPIEFEEIPNMTRAKMAHWVADDILHHDETRCANVLRRLRRSMGALPGTAKTNLQWVREIIRSADAIHVWSLVELAVNDAFDVAWKADYDSERHVRNVAERLREFNVFLGDEFIGYQVVRNNGQAPPLIVHRIDSELLHAQIVDRTFEITGAPEFVAANEHYSQAWKHYSKGDYPDAITNAAKAMESALKVVLTKMDSTIRTDNLSTSDLIRELFKRDFLPETMKPVVKQLRTLYEQAAPPLRNDSAHGDVKPFEPDASLTLLVLNLVGSLIVFSVQARGSA